MYIPMVSRSLRDKSNIIKAPPLARKYFCKFQPTVRVCHKKFGIFHTFGLISSLCRAALSDQKLALDATSLDRCP